MTRQMQCSIRALLQSSTPTFPKRRSLGAGLSPSIGHTQSQRAPTETRDTSQRPCSYIERLWFALGMRSRLRMGGSGSSVHRS